MRGAIVGFGFIASQGHLPAYRASPELAIVAVADICEARRREAARLLPGIRTYASHEELLAGEPELDFVDIATPPGVHVPIALAALERGLHVLCEKPLGVSPGEVRSLVEAGLRAGRVVMPCHNYKQAPVIRTLKRMVQEGEFGTVRTMTINTYRTTHARGTPEWNTHWRRDKAIAGGGIGMDHGSHSYYLAFDFMGGYPKAVSGRIFRRDEAYDTEDTVCCTLVYDRGLVSVYLTWDAGLRKVIYSVHGDKGGAVVDDDNLHTGSQAEGPRAVTSDFNDASHAGWFEPMLASFASAVERNDLRNDDLRDAYVCSEVIDLVYRSAAAGGAELPLILQWPE